MYILYYMCMFMGFAGYGIGDKSRYDHGTYYNICV